jgi:uncharacterized protein (UPF0248 family)
MMPIHELLNRIRWDDEFAQGEFELGYYDRVEDRIIRISFNEIFFPEHDHFAFQVIDNEGEVHNIPFHRIRQVFKNGEVIWERRV